jgi:hypothetical protein
MARSWPLGAAAAEVGGGAAAGGGADGAAALFADDSAPGETRVAVPPARELVWAPATTAERPKVMAAARQIKQAWRGISTSFPNSEWVDFQVANEDTTPAPGASDAIPAQDWPGHSRCGSRLRRAPPATH